VQVKGELTTVENLDNTHQSFARLDYHEECEAAVNEQINIEYNISYVYHALHAFFDRYTPCLCTRSLFLLSSYASTRHSPGLTCHSRTARPQYPPPPASKKEKGAVSAEHILSSHNMPPPPLSPKWLTNCIQVQISPEL